MTTIIELSPGVATGEVQAGLKATTIKVKKPWRPEIISLDGVAPVANTDDWVRERGLSLRRIFAPGGAVETALRGALLSTAVHPIYVRTLADEVEMLDWEMLYDDDGGQFLSLQGSWPIGRLTSVEFASRPPEPFPEALRFMAVLSANGQDGMLDWKHLNAEVERARKAKLKVEFVVLTGQPEIEEAVIAAGGELRGVPEKPDELARAIREFNPHVLHFFCHGSPNLGAPFLEIATSNDFLEMNSQGSLIFSVDYLHDALASSAIWLLVLNCCSGAEASAVAEADNRSLARQLAEEAEVPAAVGMATPISPADAAEFTRSFYPEFFERARKILRDDGFHPIDWATLLIPARRALSLGKDPADQREWALPVVYALAPSFAPAFVQPAATAVATSTGGPRPGRVPARARPGGGKPAKPPKKPAKPAAGPPPPLEEPGAPAEPFELRPAHTLTLQFAAQAMRTLTLPDAVKRQALAEMLAGIPETYWPDTHGDFPAGGAAP